MVRLCMLLAWGVSGLLSAFALAETSPNPSRQADALLSIDQHRATVIDRIVRDWGDQLAASSAALKPDQLRTMLMGLRADHLLAASLAGTLDGLRNVLALSITSTAPLREGLVQTKALGDIGADVTYTPVTPCRLVETRGTFAAVYQGSGAFTTNEVRTYTIQSGNGVCVSQLPAGFNFAAIQLQVFGMPTTAASGDIEILPQGATFGSTATMVYVESIAFNTVSTSAKVNTATNQISVQVRGGGAHVAIDLVGYFAGPTGSGGQYFKQGGNTFGTSAQLGTLDVRSMLLKVNNQRALLLEPSVVSPNVVGGHQINYSGEGTAGVAIGGGGADVPNGNLGSFNCHGSCANAALDSFSTIGGGAGNVAGDGTLGYGHATVSGGLGNHAYGLFSFVGGGHVNLASGQASVVPGGESNIAEGAHSFAAGTEAYAKSSGQFVWADINSHGQFDPAGFGVNGWQNAHNTFTARATGGVWFISGVNFNGIPTTGCSLQPNDSNGWYCSSSRELKTDFETVNVHEVLSRVIAMPVQTWRFSGAAKSIRHIGPTAQDFFGAFGLGVGDKVIATGDASGVALAAIQGLHAQLETQQRELRALRAKVARLQRLQKGRQ